MPKHQISSGSSFKRDGAGLTSAQLAVRPTQDMLKWINDLRSSQVDLSIGLSSSRHKKSTKLVLSSKFQEEYSHWLARFYRILSAYKKGLIKDRQVLQSLQFFLVEAGQFNACFSIMELKYFNYPRSPFAITKGHGYLRATNTWAMQIMQEHYRNQPRHKGLYTVWIDSNHFWKELKRYGRVIDSKDKEVEDSLSRVLLYIRRHGSKLISPWWIEIAKPEEGNIKKVLNKCRKDAEKYLKREIQSIDEESLKDRLIYYFRDNFQSVDVMVVASTRYTYKLVNSLGYRVNTVRITKCVLDMYPQLFVRSDETERFWDVFKKTGTFRQLPEEEQGLVEVLQRETIEPAVDLESFAVPSFTTEYDKLCSIRHKMDVAFQLYADYIRKYIGDFRLKYPKWHVIHYITDEEIKEALCIFIFAHKTKDLKLAVRAVQVIAEIMQLDFRLHSAFRPIDDIIRYKYLRGYPVQGVALISYAMRAFVRVLQVVDPIGKIAITNQSYYELLENFARLHSKVTSIQLFRHVMEVTEDTRVIFIEIHPNNAVERSQYDHNVMVLLDRMQHWKAQRRTLVLDVTLNALNDMEVKFVLDKAMPFVERGWLNLILIQSLTKFAQLGLDKCSAGCMVLVNNPHCWEFANSKFRDIALDEPAEYQIEKFFSYFLLMGNSLKKYIALVNENVRLVYRYILEQLHGLEVFELGCFQITTSSDPKACYVALNFRGLLPKVDESFLYATSDIEKFATDLLQHLVYPLCEFWELPISARESIGFPLTSVNAIYDSLRFTIGLESKKQLKKYADILVYVAFILNRLDNPEKLKKLFKLDEGGRHTFRISYFQEKSEQFKAMTRGRNCSYEFGFEEKKQIPNRKGYVRLHNGIVTLYILCEAGSEYEHYKMYRPQDIKMSIRGRGEVLFSDPSVTVKQKRMAIACLTSHIDHQNVKLQLRDYGFDGLPIGSISFINMETIVLWNIKYAYGPFFISNIPADSGVPVFFVLHQKEIYLFFGDQAFSKYKICVRKGDLKIPLSDMPLEDIDFLIRIGGYKDFHGEIPGRDFHHDFDQLLCKYNGQWIKYPKQEEDIATGFIPSTDDYTQLRYEEGQFIIERDLVCCKVPGITVYKRFLMEGQTVVEIDYWKEKDSALARFFTLMIAIWMKYSSGVEFIARNGQFSHFLVKAAFDSMGDIAESAISHVLAKSGELEYMLKNRNYIKKAEKSNYCFNPSGKLSWPITSPSVENKTGIQSDGLIEGGLAILIRGP